MMRKTLIILAALFTATSASASAIELHEARTKGFVCEDKNGLLRQKGGGRAVEDLVASTNGQRLNQYKATAASTGVSLAETQKTFGKKLRAKYHKNKC